VTDGFCYYANNVKQRMTQSIFAVTILASLPNSVMVVWQHEDNWIVTMETGGGRRKLDTASRQSYLLATSAHRQPGHNSDDNCKMVIRQLWSMK
jgi:hypothetical protein